MRISVLIPFLLFASSVSLHAQSMNIRFGSAVAAPDDDFAGVGLAGYWNSFLGAQSTYYALADLAGNSTGATLYNIGGTALVHTDSLATSGDFESLLDEYVVTYSTSLETCLFFAGLDNGTYEVMTYAWLPNQPTIESRVRLDEAPGQNQFIGGEWPGGLVEGVTHARHVIQVTDGGIGLHSGTFAASPLQMAALNAVQLVRYQDFGAFLRRGDANADDAIDIADPITLLAYLFGVGAGPNCEDTFDANDDGAIDVADPIAVLNALFGLGPMITDECLPDFSPDALGCVTASCPSF